nr:bifunctional aminoglycoside phosphotransferase/ATP-binding protein [Altererythrobacter sp. KTW20L]
MVRSGPLDSALTRQLARAIADFHGSAEVARGDGTRKIQDVIEGNRVSMAALPEGLLSKEKCNRLFYDSLAMAEPLAGLLNERSARGFMRHCHGDLHLGNICVWQGRATLFDCLEFDAHLATIDLLYDLAFLLMDMWHRGHHSEASLLFNRYCDLRGENDGLAVLPLFLSMRAAVRAHVEGTAATRLEPATARDAKIQVARGYLDAALALLERPTARLIAIGGLSGSGKSTLAASLAPLTGTPPGARWLRTDVLRKKLAGVEPEAHLPESAYTSATHEAVYRALLDEVRTTLAAGWPVIVDAVFDFPDTRKRIRSLADDLGIPFKGLWLEASRHILHERVRRRKGDASDAGPAVVDKQLQRDIGSLAGWARVDADCDAGQTLLHACAALGFSKSAPESR